VTSTPDGTPDATPGPTPDVDLHDHRIARDADGLLAAANRAEVLTAADVHVARRTAALVGETDERVELAVALAVRAVRRGSVALDLAAVATEVGDVGDLDWPEPASWRAAVAASPLLTEGVLRDDLHLLYLDRYHRLETQVCADLLRRAAAPPPVLDEARLAAAQAATGLHTDPDARVSEEQQDAADRAVRRTTTILTGGPGTGKTSTVGRVLLLLADQADAAGRPLSVAVTAPTGKAATRLEEAVRESFSEIAGRGPEAAALVARAPRVQGVTLHRLLGWRPDNQTRFRHHRGNRLGHDVVVVDESSMVELTMMGRLLESLRDSTRLLLVGDPQQLTSVGAGAVLGDMVAGHPRADDPSSPVAALTTNFRSQRHIRDLAEATRATWERTDDDAVAAADRVLEILRDPARATEVTFVEVDPDDPGALEAVVEQHCLPHARSVRDAAVAGDVTGALVALDRHRLLCAHRSGPWGTERWNRVVERRLAEDPRPGGSVAPLLPAPGAVAYVGRPLLVTRNDYALDLYNGETGVVVGVDGRLRACFGRGGGHREVAPGRLDDVDTMHAMTVHKSQGSQAAEVTVLLPGPDSRLLTRELFYTAVTRAQAHVRVVGSEAAVRTALRVGAQRATGLRQRLELARR